MGGPARYTYNRNITAIRYYRLATGRARKVSCIRRCVTVSRHLIRLEQPFQILLVRTGLEACTAAVH